MQAILDAITDQQLPAKVVAVISNKPEAYGLQRAASANVETRVLEYKGFADRDAYDQQLQLLIDSYHPDLVILAGFMRILSDAFVTHYSGRMLNIHPSLLPKYKGLNTHQRVIDAGDEQHGCTVHFVTPELDSGPIVLQSSIPVHSSDTATTLAQRVHQQEHVIYPQAIRMIAEGQLKLSDSNTTLEQ